MPGASASDSSPWALISRSLLPDPRFLVRRVTVIALHRPLSPRLQALADWVPAGARLADVATDHALLPEALLRTGRIASAIATDLRREPLEHAARRLARTGAPAGLELRCGDGLSVLRAGECDVVCIAGLGGLTIARLLEAGAAVLAPVRRLVLQPMSAHEHVRGWLRDHGQELVDERLTTDGERLYASLLAEPGEGWRPYRAAGVDPDLGLLAGPFLLRQRDPRWLERWRHELHQLERSLAQAGSRAPAGLRRRRQLVLRVVESAPAEPC